MAIHRIGTVQYLATFVALAALASVSLLLALFWKVPYWSVVVGMGLATAKAFLVLWYFMHMAEQPFRTRLVVMVSALLVILLISLTAADVTTRHHIPRRGLPGSRNDFYLR